MSRFATLYRAACADLALADAYQFPPGTIQYLHQLVGRAHNQLYRSHTFRFGTWLRQLFLGVPQRLFNDNALRLAFCIFWGPFLLSMFLAYSSREYAEQVMGDAMLGQLEENFSKPMAGRDPNENLAMAGFYIQHNGTIGLQCFAFGMFFGIGGLVLTISNAQVLRGVRAHGRDRAVGKLFQLRHGARAVRVDGDRAHVGRRDAAGLLDDRHAGSHPQRLAGKGGGTVRAHDAVRA